jgi:hypothetical protein
MDNASSINEQLWNVWQRLGPHWTPYFKAAGLDLTKVTRKDFRDRLIAPIKNLKRDVDGLQDLAPQCQKGIEPGDPALSLFYHALASPHVHPPGIESRPENYPTIADLEVVENFIYAEAEMTVDKLRAKAKGRPLAIVVFAYEYAPAEDTIHGLHADLCFSRTGISRVGNAPYQYNHEARGFFPFTDGSSRAHVVPARFGAFVAYQRNGRRGTLGPQDFLPNDEKLDFWVPIHKLFRGPECIKNFDLDLSFEVAHVNEKIGKIHLALKSTAFSPAQMDKPPFVITEKLASFCQSQGLMIPFVHDPLVSPAMTDDGKYVGFQVPPKQLGESALWLDKKANTRSSPEFVHIRYKIDEKDGNQELVYLPDTTPTQDIVPILKAGGFQAANFVDWTADGYIKANSPALALALNGNENQSISLAAYSILAQPDFFPLVTQRGLTAWAKESRLKAFIWPDQQGITPNPLSGARLPANITLNGGAVFDAADTTVSAIVGTDRPEQPGATELKLTREQPMRQSTLSNRSSSLFDPGWDISGSSLHPETAKEDAFMANYGLGSPFPEDTLICSAFGSFWPGASPDITRFFSPSDYPSTTPILDSEAKDWDAVKPPTIRTDSIDYQALPYADFVKAIYEGKFNYARFAKVSLQQYILRTTVTAGFYKYLQTTERIDATDPEQRRLYIITSFDITKEIPAPVRAQWDSPAKETFEIQFGKALNVSSGGFHPHARTAPDPRITTTNVDSLRVIYVGSSQVAHEDPPGSGKWNVLPLP